MELVLRRDDGGENHQLVSDDGSRGFVAGGFEGQDAHE
jgi:hypothetical protein